MIYYILDKVNFNKQTSNKQRSHHFSCMQIYKSQRALKFQIYRFHIAINF